MILVGRPLVGIPGRNGDALDAQVLGGESEEIRRFPGVHLVEQRTIDVDAKAHFLGRADRRDGALEGARLVDGVVVMVFHAVQMDRKRQVGRRRKLIELLFKQQRIGAQIDELLAPDDAFDNGHDILVYQRFPPGDGNYRGAAFINRVQAFLGAEPLIEDIVFIVDLAAADTRQIAAEQGFQHQNEGVFFPAGEALAQDICADADFLN